MRREAKCKSCGRKVLFVQDHDRKVLCLDAVAPCYSVDSHGTGVRDKDVYVSHFATCPNASSHSKRESGPRHGRPDAKPKTAVRIVGSTYEVRETLKGIGFRWDSSAREWRGELADEEIDKVAESLPAGVRLECEV